MFILNDERVHSGMQFLTRRSFLVQLWLRLASAYHKERGIDWNQVKEKCFTTENIVRDDVIDEEIFKVSYVSCLANRPSQSMCLEDKGELSTKWNERKIHLKCDITLPARKG